MSISEDLKKVVLAGIGAAAVTYEKSKEVVDSLVEKGELTVAQGKVINEELKRKAAEKRETAAAEAAKAREAQKAEAAQKTANSILDAVDTLTPEQRAALKAKLEQFDNNK